MIPIGVMAVVAGGLVYLAVGAEEPGEGSAIGERRATEVPQGAPDPPPHPGGDYLINVGDFGSFERSKAVEIAAPVEGVWLWLSTAEGRIRLTDAGATSLGAAAGVGVRIRDASEEALEPITPNEVTITAARRPESLTLEERMVWPPNPGYPTPDPEVFVHTVRLEDLGERTRVTWTMRSDRISLFEIRWVCEDLDDIVADLVRAAEAYPDGPSTAPDRLLYPQDREDLLSKTPPPDGRALTLDEVERLGGRLTERSSGPPPGYVPRPPGVGP